MERVQDSAFLFLIFENVNNYRCIELSSLTYVEDESDFFFDQRNKILIASSNIMLKMLLSASSWIFLFKCTCSFPRSHTVKLHNNIKYFMLKKSESKSKFMYHIWDKVLGFLFYWMRFKQYRKITSSFNCYLQMPPEAAVIHTHASVSQYSQSEHRRQQLISQSECAGDSQSGHTAYSISQSQSGQSSSISQSEYWVCNLSQSGLGVSISAISN